jgi:cardiolipin synthase
VKVHILIDWVGSQKMDEALLKEMQNAGAEIYKYHPPRWYNINRLNNRTHRKILVTDGHVGFTGGVGIADEWGGHAQDKDHWRDTHYRIEGPAVAQMQAAFVDNWLKVSGAVLHGDAYFPALKPAGEHYAQMFMSSQEGGAESMHLMYLLSIAAARKSIDLSMAYFVPDELASDALTAAIKRGVRVRIILPGQNTDTALVRSAGRATWGPFLQAGAQIHEFQPTMYHCKVLVVDGLWVSVGSTNFDTPLVSPQRRGQPQRPRPRVRRAPARRLREGPQARAPHHLRRMGLAALAREDPGSLPVDLQSQL